MNIHLSGRGINRNFYLPRLASEFYQGDAVVHWTMPIAGRNQNWLNNLFHAHFREIVVHAAVRQNLLCPAYCLMPDHIHLVLMGLKTDSDQRKALKFLREYVGKALQPFRFQHQAHDHVLRDEERKRNAFAKVCFYILANPVRAGLIEENGAWPYQGAVVPGYPDVDPMDQDFWPLFWKLYHQIRDPKAGERRLAPRQA